MSLRRPTCLLTIFAVSLQAATAPAAVDRNRARIDRVHARLDPSAWNRPQGSLARVPRPVVSGGRACGAKVTRRSSQAASDHRA